MLPSDDCREGRFNCAVCSADTGTRSALHCGQLERDKWAARAELPPAFGGEPYTADICPGALVRSPSVVEGSQACMALKSGALDAYYPDLENPIVEAAAVALRSFNMFENEQMQKVKQKHG